MTTCPLEDNFVVATSCIAKFFVLRVRLRKFWRIQHDCRLPTLISNAYLCVFRKTLST
jgi:hypothetical protein